MVIEVTAFDGRKIMLNAELIETIESVPETLISLTTGKRLLVKEPLSEVTEMILEYRRLIHQPPGSRN
jgi:flagellar protein FlbD